MLLTPRTLDNNGSFINNDVVAGIQIVAILIFFPDIIESNYQKTLIDLLNKLNKMRVYVDE